MTSSTRDRPVTDAPASETTLREEEAVSSSHAVALDVPPSWLDRLLVALGDLPLGEGEEAVARSFAGSLASILPQFAVGVCVVTVDANGRGRRQIALKHEPEGRSKRASFVDAARLFPGYACERILPIPGNETSTVHVAADAEALDEIDRAVHLIQRGVGALGAALESARGRSVLSGCVVELRAVEEHLIQADKLASFGEIAAGLVHELNNPLTSIVAYSDHLLRKARARIQAGEAVDTEDVDKLKRISDSADRMLRFTRELTSYARPSPGRPVPVVVHDVIDQALAFCEHVIAQAKATVERRFGSDVRTVRGMPEQLAQVFVNLFTNACHAMPASDGRLIISTETVDDGSSVLIVVEDNGHGIAEEHLSRVFLPFYTTKGEGRGTGLGLSIVKSIVERHDGDIRVESTPPEGTRFFMRLPGWTRG
jgi:two-component system, NtrC family, sensor kinase